MTAIITRARNAGYSSPVTTLRYRASVARLLRTVAQRAGTTMPSDHLCVVHSSLHHGTQRCANKGDRDPHRHDSGSREKGGNSEDTPKSTTWHIKGGHDVRTYMLTEDPFTSPHLASIHEFRTYTG